MRQIKILMIDDNKDDFDLTERILKSKGLPVIMRHVDNPLAMSAAMQSKKPEIILVDSGGVCFDARNILRARGWPFIAFSGSDSEEVKEGAMAFVNKKDMEILPSVIESIIGTKGAKTKLPAGTTIETLISKCDTIIVKIKNKVAAGT